MKASDLLKRVASSLELMRQLDGLNARWRAATDKCEQWQILRETYAIMTPLILRGRVMPYFLDWAYHRTPIEELAWIDIRGAGLPFYPQYPVLHYFIDFADPIQQIAVELDGAAYHDASRDEVRDRRLLEHGWRTFRIPGKRSLRSPTDIRELTDGCQNATEIIEALAAWGREWSEGFFWALGYMYYRKPTFPGLDRAESREAALRILMAHQLIEFDLDPGEGEG
jgi:very-short-patch-repair endonuclease